jgi:hypothetical protein
MFTNRAKFIQNYTLKNSEYKILFLPLLIILNKRKNYIKTKNCTSQLHVLMLA